MRAIITVVGKDRVGIIAKVSTFLAESQINILDISQTILSDYFTMMMIVDASAATLSLQDIRDRLSGLGKGMGLSITFQLEQVFQAMHRIDPS